MSVKQDLSLTLAAMNALIRMNARISGSVVMEPAEMFMVDLNVIVLMVILLDIQV